MFLFHPCPVLLYKPCTHACDDVIADTVLGAVTFHIRPSLMCVWTHALSAPGCFSIQEFHYHPRGSDSCLPCDCYPVGSFSRSCDPETGQCQCRPGVIGRQCNTCDNPFAEVTNSGCEGEQAYVLLWNSVSLCYVSEWLVYLPGSCVVYFGICHAQCQI